MSKVDWPALRAAAVQVMRRAYAPYSKYPVGAAGLADDGRIVLGCNVENASYGVVLCAECGMVSQLHATGGGRLIAMACVDADGEPLLPCGRCRQLLWENGGPSMLVDSKTGPLTMEYLLPLGFGQENLAALASPARGSGLDDQEPGDDRPKRPPSRSVKKKQEDQAPPEQPKARTGKKLSLRDLDAEEPETDAPRGRKQGGLTARGAAAVPAAKTATRKAAAPTAPPAAESARRGVAKASAAQSGSAEESAGGAQTARRGAAAKASSAQLGSVAAEESAGRGGAGKVSAAQSGGAAEESAGGGRGAGRGGVAKAAAGRKVAEEEAAGRQGKAGAGRARGKGAAR